MEAKNKAIIEMKVNLEATENRQIPWKTQATLKKSHEMERERNNGIKMIVNETIQIEERGKLTSSNWYSEQKNRREWGKKNKENSKKVS